MGEELELGQLYIKAGDGDYVLYVPFNGIESADIVVCDDMDEETYYSLPQEGTISFSCMSNICRSDLLLLMLGGNERTIRRALRWYERLRRYEVKGKFTIRNKLYLAVQCARYKSNNGNRACRYHAYIYTLDMNKEE